MAQTPTGPVYTAAGLVNAASNTAGPLAPNTLATLYGTGLAFATRAITAEDIRANTLPTTLPGTGVRVLVANQPANLYYVSPTQINFLIPNNLIPGKFELQVLLDGRAGPGIAITLADSSPELFAQGDRIVIAAKTDGSFASVDAPARPGEIVVLYATGLGRTIPDLPANRIATAAAVLERIADFRVFLNGLAVDPKAILYAGLVPGFGGLYQINLRLPDPLPADPEIRIGFLEPTSVPGVRIAAKPLAPLP